MPTEYGAASSSADDTEFRKSRRCNDVIFALLFVAHLVLIVLSWITYTPEDVNVDFADRGVWKFVGACTGISLLLSTLTLFFMAVFADELVEIALVVSLACTAAVGGYGVYVWKYYMMIVGGVAFLAVLVFTCHVWKKIPVRCVACHTDCCW